VARCALRTKVEVELADALAPIVTEAVRIVAKPTGPVDLFMVEILTMQHRSSMETRLVRGLVLDHGGRHPGMPKSLKKCFILAMNVSLEYEKTEVNSEAVYKTAEERDRLVVSERKFIDDRVRQIIDLKRAVCDETNGCTFVILNQKAKRVLVVTFLLIAVPQGIDPPALDMLAKEGILGLRRAKRRNMERVTLACGGQAVNSLEGLQPSDLGKAEHVYEQVLGEEKFTFVEGVTNPTSCTVLIKGPTSHAVEQTRDAVRDGLRAVKNTIQASCLLLFVLILFGDRTDGWCAEGERARWRWPRSC
jgi:T-complex protein 1 subunit zeta